MHTLRHSAKGASLWQAVLGVIAFTLASMVFSSEYVAAVACPTDKGASVTSGHGWRASTGTWHAGIDIGLGEEVGPRPVYAAAGGEVRTEIYDGYGLTKDLHTGGRVYRYAHLSEGGVSGTVGEGDRIGNTGSSGNATGHVLHWEIRTDGGGFGIDGTIDPLNEYKACSGGGSSGGPSGANPNPTNPNPTNPNPTPVQDPNDVGSNDCHNLILRKNNYGGCVRHLQVELNEHNYNLSLNSQFDQNTHNAVVDLQSRRDLDTDGRVGPLTWKAIHTKPSAPAPTNTNPNPVFTPTQPLNTGTKIIGQQSDRCLDVSGESQSSGAPVHIWDCHGKPNQRWRFEGGMIKVYGNKCLDVSNESTSDGAQVIIWDCSGGANQRWRFENGRIKIYANKCLDVRGYGTHNGAAVQIWECHGDTNQQWWTQQ
jgi:murein DD-endopeptidase MepM/ murein hydrolase activator NlpD